MTLALGYKHPREFRHISHEKVAELERRVIDSFRCMQNAPLILSGGLAIQFLTKLYSERDKESLELYSLHLKNPVDGFYRDSSGVIHYTCMEQDLETIAAKTEENGMGIYQITSTASIGGGIKVDAAHPITPKQIREGRETWKREKHTSHRLRIMKNANVKGHRIGDYFDLFVHHYKDSQNNIVTRDGYKFTAGERLVSQSEVYIVSNKEGITLPLASFQPIQLCLEGTKISIANPKYLFEVKKEHMKKREKEGKKDDPRDIVDLDVLNAILQYTQTSVLDRIRNAA